MAAAPEEQLDYGLEGEDDMDDIQAMLAEAEEANKESTVLAEQGKADASDLLAKKEAEDKAKAERDERSVFVQNVHFNAKVDDLMAFFSTCGAIDRCTIVADKFGQPKGFAYVEFATKDAVANALLLDEGEFLARTLKIVPKRTNLPHHMLGGRGGRGGGERGRGRGGWDPTRGGGRGRGRGGGMMPMMMMPAPYMAAGGMFYAPMSRGGRGGGGYRGGAPRGRGWRGRGT